LGVDPAFGEVLAAAANFGGVNFAGAFFLCALHDLELDGETVAVPAGDKGDFVAGHCFGFNDEVFESFVKGGSHVDVAIGKGRAIVEGKAGGAVGFFLIDDLFEEAFFVPSL